MSLTGQCFDFTVAVCGEEALLRQAAVSQFVTRVEDPATPVAVYHFDFDIKDCPDAAFHRIHMMELIDTSPESWEPYLMKRCLPSLDLCVLVDHRDDAAADVCAWCKRANVRLLMVLSHEDALDNVADSAERVYCDIDDVGDVSRAVGELLREIHSERAYAVELDRERQWLIAQGEARAPKRTAAPLAAAPADAVFCPHHVADVQYTVNMVLVGAPASGKTTFMTATLDDFVLPDYEPTRHIDIGTFSVALNAHTAVNCNVYDGPVRAKVADAHLVFLFVDLSSRSGIDDATLIADALDLKHQYLVVVGSKADPFEVTTATADVQQLAASIGGTFVLIDPREKHERLLCGAAAAVVKRQQQMSAELNRLLTDSSRRSARPTNFVQLGC